MKKAVRTGVGILLGLMLLFGAGKLGYWYLQSRENAAAGEEAKELIDLPETKEPPSAAPEPTDGPAAEPSPELPPEQPLPTPEPEPTEEPQREDPVAAALLENELTALQAKNPDVVGWIVIPDTPISYPVLQGEDNEYYLKHNWKKQRNSGGSIFMECQNSPDFGDFNTILYGHRMRDDSMFHALQDYEDPDFLADHPRVYLVTGEGVRIYQVFAAANVGITDPVYWLIDDQEEYKRRMIDFCLEYSVVDTGLRPQGTDQLLTLSTCTSVRGSDRRWIVAAVQIGILEEP